MRAFTYERAATPAAAVAAVVRAPGAKFIAGGTNLLDLMKLQIETPSPTTRGLLDRGAYRSLLGHYGHACLIPPAHALTRATLVGCPNAPPAIVCGLAFATWRRA